jgi:integrase
MLETESAIRFHARRRFRSTTARNEPLWASRRPEPAERRRFVKAAAHTEPKTRLFRLTLGWSGARISEVLALTPASIDIESGVASIETLKRRRPVRDR